MVGTQTQTQLPDFSEIMQKKLKVNGMTVSQRSKKAHQIISVWSKYPCVCQLSQVVWVKLQLQIYDISLQYNEKQLT